MSDPSDPSEPDEESPPESSAGFRRLLGLALGAAVALVAVLFVAGYVFSKRGAGAGSSEVPLSSAMPIAIGDSLSLRDGAQSCTVDVLGELADGRVLGVACGGGAPGPLARSLLFAEGFARANAVRSLLPGDVVLARTHAGWLRALVIAVESGTRIRVHPLGTPTAATEVVQRADIARVQRAQTEAPLHVPLPAALEVHEHDALYMRHGAAWSKVAVAGLSDGKIQVSAGSEAAPAAFTRSELWALAVRVGDPLAAGSLVALRDGASWLRRSVVSDASGSLSVKPEGGGAEELRPKRDVLRLDAR